MQSSPRSYWLAPGSLNSGLRWTRRCRLDFERPEKRLASAYPGGLNSLKSVKSTENKVDRSDDQNPQRKQRIDGHRSGQNMHNCDRATRCNSARVSHCERSLDREPHGGPLAALAKDRGPIRGAWTVSPDEGHSAAATLAQSVVAPPTPEERPTPCEDG